MPCFFENEQGEAVTINGDRYRAMLNEFLFTNIEEEDIGGYVPHSMFCALFLAPQGCDFTPLDYYLWGAFKNQCYADKPQTIDALKDNIREAIGEIQLHTIDNVLKSWTDRVGMPRKPFE